MSPSPDVLWIRCLPARLFQPRSAPSAIAGAWADAFTTLLTRNVTTIRANQKNQSLKFWVFEGSYESAAVVPGRFGENRREVRRAPREPTVIKSLRFTLIYQRSRLFYREGVPRRGSLLFPSALSAWLLPFSAPGKTQRKAGRRRTA